MSDLFTDATWTSKRFMNFIAWKHERYAEVARKIGSIFGLRLGPTDLFGFNPKSWLYHQGDDKRHRKQKIFKSTSFPEIEHIQNFLNNESSFVQDSNNSRVWIYWSFITLTGRQLVFRVLWGRTLFRRKNHFGFHFHLDGCFSKHNCLIWDSKKPYKIHEVCWGWGVSKHATEVLLAPIGKYGPPGDVFPTRWGWLIFNTTWGSMPTNQIYSIASCTSKVKVI